MVVIIIMEIKQLEMQFKYKEEIENIVNNSLILNFPQTFYRSLIERFNNMSLQDSHYCFSYLKSYGEKAELGINTQLTSWMLFLKEEIIKQNVDYFFWRFITSYK